MVVSASLVLNAGVTRVGIITERALVPHAVAQKEP